MMAKKSKLKKSPKEDFFVSISDPPSIRLPLLESTREILESMKVFQNIKHLRARKREEKTKLRRQLKQISQTVKNLKHSMPHIKEIQTKNTKKVILEIKPEEEVEIAKKQAPRRTEIDRIEEGLKEIQAKLSRLG